MNSPCRLTLGFVGAVGTATLCGLLIAGCKVGPDYKRPSTPTPASYTGATNITATNGWKLAQPQASLPKGNWWEIFGDAGLNRLEADAAQANQELKAAVAQFDQARASTDVARSGLFPHIGLSGSATRQRDSVNRPVNGLPAGQTETYNTFTVPLDFSYEVDLWGRVRREVEAANANQNAAAADLQSVRLLIQAEVAVDYFTLRTLDAELSLLRSNVVVFKRSVELTRNRRAGGIATDLDVAQAESLLKSTEAQIPVTALARLQAQHSLAVLTGRVASAFSLPENPLDLVPPRIPAGVPSELLERRPDIASAEDHMAAANANVGVTKAAYYPTIKLNGLAGLQSVDAGTFFDWPSRFWAVGPSLSLPLFEGGRLRANERQAKALYEQTVANYRQTVLTAFAEVEDNLCAQDLLADATESQTIALRAADRTLEIANNRYRSGLVTYLEVATAQATALSTEREVVRLQGQQFLSTVALAKSLGGGWK